MISNSMMFSFTGELVDWITYTSQPRILSSMLIWISPSLNWETEHFPNSTPITFAISSASSTFELSEKTFKFGSRYWFDIVDLQDLFLYVHFPYIIFFVDLTCTCQCK